MTKSMIIVTAALAASAASARAQERGVITTAVDIGGMPSMDGLGDPDNAVMSVALASGAHVTGLGYDVAFSAFGQAWLSEMGIFVGDSSGVAGTSLLPGTGSNFPGTTLATSGGIIDLVGLGADFHLAEDGLLRLEFWQIGGVPDAQDGLWDSGTLAVQWVPAPSSLALLALGGVVAGRRRRG